MTNLCRFRVGTDSRSDFSIQGIKCSEMARTCTLASVLYRMFSAVGARRRLGGSVTRVSTAGTIVYIKRPELLSAEMSILSTSYVLALSLNRPSVTQRPYIHVPVSASTSQLSFAVRQALLQGQQTRLLNVHEYISMDIMKTFGIATPSVCLRMAYRYYTSAHTVKRSPAYHLIMRRVTWLQPWTKPSTPMSTPWEKEM